MICRKIAILLSAIFILTANCRGRSAVVPESSVSGRRSFDFIRLMALNGARARRIGKAHDFISPRFRCRVSRNARRCEINGIKVDLNFPVAYIGNTPYVTGFDWHKSFRPLLYPATLKKHPISTITIDMGHGGSDPGAIGAFSREKNITLKVGRRLGEILKSYGFRVRFTRNSDIKLPLERVAALQRSHKSDLFVSLHVNSAKDRSVYGIETFCLTPLHAPSSGAKVVQRDNKRGNWFDENNLALAYSVQRQLLRRTGAPDRGVKRANFVVLRDLNVPGILVEMGFISNPAEERRLNNSGYIDALAKGIADGIIQYRRSMK